MKKLIEVALPLKEINANTLREKKYAAGHPANLHLWWGRSPVSSVRSALAAAMIDAPESKDELIERLNRVQSGALPELGKKPTVYDPFCGYGGVPLAAQALGLPVVAGELNPVAVMLTKAAVELPAKFAGHGAVNRLSLDDSGVGAHGLAEDVAFYGEWLCEQAEEKLKDLYPAEEDGVPAAWIWTRTVKCQNPACGYRMPLASSFVLYSKGGNEIWAEPVMRDGKIHFELKSGVCPEERRSNKTSKQGAAFRCPACGSITTDAYVKQMGAERQIGAQLMAIAIETSDGLRYVEPNEAQENAANVPAPDDVPPGEIPDNAHWFSPPGFGFKNYSDLFSPRQLTMLTTFSSLLTDVQSKVASDALAAGMDAFGGGLADGGSGALAYGQAIGVYLALVVDKLADANSTICSWRTTGGLRYTFGRQAIPMVWIYAEGNPFSHVTGNFTAVLKSVVEAIKRLPCGGATVNQADARAADFPSNCVVCTELPYYKAIGYAHLSDYFYIWMRKSLKAVYPELFSQLLTPKNELSTIGQYHGKEPSECERLYESQLRGFLEKSVQSANREYPHLFFYVFHRVDKASLASTSQDAPSSPFEKLIDSMVGSGYSVSALWPMRSVPASDKADGVRILIVASLADRAVPITRRSFASTLKRELPGIIARMLCAGVDDCDKALVGIGCGLSVFTRYKKVLNADGSDMCPHDALQIIYQEVNAVIADYFLNDEPAESKED